MHNKLLILTTKLLLALGLAGLPALAEDAASANNEPKKPNQNQPADSSQDLTPSNYSGGYFSIAAEFNELDGSMDRVSEFESAIQGTRATSRLGLWGHSDGFTYDLEGFKGIDAADQQYNLGIDLKRIWKSELQITKLPHRLINDPLTNLDTGKGAVIVLHDSLDEGINYCPAYQNTEWKNRLNLPFLPLVTLHFDYRHQVRKGSYQARTMSKCANCHVVSDVRAMDRETEEFRTGIEIGNSKAKLQYEFVNRDFRENSGSPMNVWDEVRHPANLARVFTNRAQFEASDGPLPYNQLPRFKKNEHLLKGRVELPQETGEVVGTYVNSRSDNSSLGYGVDTQVASGRYAVKLGDRFRFSMVARNLDTDSDTIFVDVNERLADFGPQTGKSYGEAYPDIGELDFLQSSMLAREQFDFTLDGRILLPGNSLLRVGYEFENLERPSFEVEQTRTNRLKVSFNTASSKDLKARMRYTLEHSDTPFVHEHAALPPALQPFPSPGSPPSPLAGTQYFSVYRARVADLSNHPRNSHQFAGSSTWAPTDTLALTAHFRAQRDTNDQLNDIANWSDTEISPSAELWYAPNERIDFLANYSFHHRKTESLFGIAVYDG